ncbi:MAG TPA: alpha-hydroxy-acid oxidizing protein [Solirubrobacterales bacterium]|jgi:L-lactate dehydrogenase (cytochrome)|nr:alpha-hydroxy-acid oxidizing protein [Solirubrobacterales bacterium]
MADFADYNSEIYLRGLGGETLSLPVSIAALERAAAEAMDERAAAYVFAGAGSEDTMDANREAFSRRRIVPRMLRDIADRDLSTTLLGTAMPAPLLLAPIGVQKVVHPDGELATARAAASLGVPMIASTVSHFSLEEIAAAGGDAPRWFQLYLPNDRDLAASFIGRAEAADYGAIVLTVDTFVPGWKPRDLQQAWVPYLHGLGVANFFEDPVFRAGLERPPEEDVGAATGHFLGIRGEPSLDWDDVEWLRGQTELPIVLKGIQHPDDAREAARRGAAGVVVSNHGGRQVDGAIASLDALPPIVEAAGDDLTILFDSGIRGGSDAIKALALGADAVCIGRPYIWGLALEGQTGVETVLKTVLADLDLTMALCGYTHPGQLGPDSLAKGQSQ